MSESCHNQKPSDGGSDQRLVRLIVLSRKVVKTSDEPECGCEYQHERCAAMDYRNAVRELESFIKEIEPIEVGTPVARRPPRRSRRAELPHRAPRWTRSQCDAGPRFVVGLDHAFPVFRRNTGVNGSSTTRGGGRSQPGRRRPNCVQVIDRRWLRRFNHL